MPFKYKRTGKKFAPDSFYLGYSEINPKEQVEIEYPGYADVKLKTGEILLATFIEDNSLGGF